MHPLLWILLLGAGYAVVKRRNDVADLSFAGGRLIDVSALVKNANPNAPERFQDAIYECIGTGPESALSYRWKLSYLEGKPYIMGYEYLSGVPNSGAARVAAMRARIIEHRTKNTLLPPSNAASERSYLEALKWGSRQQLEQLSNSVLKYQKYENVMSAMTGITKEEAIAKAKAIFDAADLKHSYQLIETAAREIPPVAKAIALGAAKVAGLINDSDLTDEEKFAAAAHVTLDIVGMVPVYGTIAAAAGKAILGIFETKLAREREAGEQACRDFATEINLAEQGSVKLGLPVPWHVRERFSDACKFEAGSTHRTYDQTHLLAIYERSLDTFQGEDAGQFRSERAHGVTTHEEMGLSTRQRNWVKQWWALANTYMGNENVYEVFEALGRDDFGGIIASDEQVMLVAAPVAASHGWNVDEFAAALYDYSKGWRSTPQDTWVRRDYFDYDGTTPDSYVGKQCTMQDGGPLVRNAWWLNWAVLAEDAFDLAEVFKPGVAASGGASSEVLPVRYPVTRVPRVDFDRR